jgi:predicted ATPase/DNA-binding SARP family transcriptional activator
VLASSKRPVDKPIAWFGVLGPLELQVAGQSVPVGGPKQRTLLALLLLRPNQVFPRDELVEELWAGKPPSTAVNALQGYVSDLRQAFSTVEVPGFGPERLVTRAPGYLLQLEPGELDLEVFERLLSEATRAVKDRRPAAAAAKLREALDIWRGSPLAEFSSEFLHAERSRLEELRLTALEDRIDAELALGRHTELVGEITGLVAEHPLRERLRGQLMVALYHAGRQADALDVYWSTRTTLVDELGIEPSVTLQRLHQAILRQDPSLEPALAPPQAAARRIDVPAPTVPLVGRESELADSRRILGADDVRLLTLTGPGGVGKTRLSIEIARTLAEDFDDGAAFVALDSLREADLVIPTIGRALGLAKPGDVDALDELDDYLRDRNLLLALDNLEQLLDAAPALGRLLAGAPRLKLLVTSRAPLRLAGEHEFRLAPLPVPAESLRSPSALLEIPSVALFVQRAQAANRDFSLTNGNAAAVAEICSRLEGLPLSLELAAARVKLLTPESLLERLSDRLAVLTAGPRDAPARHEALTATIEWSYELLDREHQQLFDRLAVFAGGFTLEAAEAVCGDTPDILDGVGALVDDSLLLPAAADERFRMLDTIREYAVRRLEEGGAADDARRAHFDYFLGVAETADDELTGPDQRTWLRRLESEHNNLRAAYAYASTLPEGNDAIRLASALRRFWRLHGHLADGRRMLEAALAREASVSPELRAKALNGLGTLVGEQGDLSAAQTAFEESLSLARSVDAPDAMSSALANLGNIDLFEGRLEAAQAKLEESVRLCRQIGDVRSLAVSLENLGCIALEQDRLDDAAELLAESETLARGAGSERNIAGTLSARARALVLLGELEEAAALLEESAEIGRALNDRHAIADALDGFAGLAAAGGDAERAAVLSGAADAVWDSLGAARPRDQSAWRERVLATPKDRLDGEAFAKASERGRNLEIDDAVELALAMRERDDVVTGPRSG